MADESSIATPASTNEPETPSERATLQIVTHPFGITVSSQGTTAAVVLALGVIGPAATIMAGHSVGFPIWAIMVICVLQIAAAIMRRRN